MELKTNEKIRIMCGRAGLSLSELARKLGKSPQNFIQQFNRNNFRVSDLEEIAAALGVDLVVEFREKNPGGKQ